MARRLFASVCSAAQGLHCTVLSNGVAVATLDSPGTMYATGLLLKCRPSATVPLRAIQGGWFALERLLGSRLQSAVDALRGGQWGATAARLKRDHLMLTVATQGDHLQQMSELLAREFHQIAQSGELLERGEFEAILDYELQEIQRKPLDCVPDLMHAVAFPGQLPGYSLRTLRENLFDVRGALAGICPSDMVVVAAGSGVEHERFVALAARLYAESGRAAGCSPENAGECAAPSPSGAHAVECKQEPLLHVAVGVPCVHALHPDSASVAVIGALLGGGNAFSSGGPGKGMYSRLYTEVLGRFPWIETAKSMHAAYPAHGTGNGGFFGIHCAGPEDRLEDMLAVVRTQFADLARKPPAGTELARARMQVKSALLGNLESRPVQLEHLAEQAASGRLRAERELVAEIEAVSTTDIGRVAAGFDLSTARFVAFGQVGEVPPREALLSGLLNE